MEEISEEEARLEKERRDNRLKQNRNQWTQDDVAYAISTNQLNLACEGLPS